jgi:hypothetical protein
MCIYYSCRTILSSKLSHFSTMFIRFQFDACISGCGAWRGWMRSRNQHATSLAQLPSTLKTPCSQLSLASTSSHDVHTFTGNCKLSRSLFTRADKIFQSADTCPQPHQPQARNRKVRLLRRTTSKSLQYLRHPKLGAGLRQQHA